MMQLPGLKQHMVTGWYRVRISGQDVSPEELTCRMNESLQPGAVIHIVPRTEGAKDSGVFQFVAGAALAVVGYALGWTGIGAVVGSAGVSMMLGGVAQMLTPKPKVPGVTQADNGKQNTWFSSLDNMIAQGNPMPVPYGETMVGSRRISQMLSTRDEGSPDKVLQLGRKRRRRHGATIIEKIPEKDIPGFTTARVVVRGPDGKLVR